MPTNPVQCLYCGGEPDHKHQQGDQHGHSCGGCCANHGGVAGERVYGFIDLMAEVSLGRLNRILEMEKDRADLETAFVRRGERILALEGALQAAINFFDSPESFSHSEFQHIGNTVMSVYFNEEFTKYRGKVPYLDVFVRTRCGVDKSPPGWWCRRDRGHSGPCAADPIPVETAIDEICKRFPEHHAHSYIEQGEGDVCEIQDVPFYGQIHVLGRGKTSDLAYQDAYYRILRAERKSS